MTLVSVGELILVFVSPDSEFTEYLDGTAKLFHYSTYITLHSQCNHRRIDVAKDENQDSDLSVEDVCEGIFEENCVRRCVKESRHIMIVHERSQCPNIWELWAL